MKKIQLPVIPPQVKVGRPPVSQRRILQALQRRIIRGEFQPEDRLPTRRELVQKYGVGLPAVQQALDQLARDGFVESRGPLGTFVASKPPHLNRYLLVFDTRVGYSDHSWFREALANEAQRLSSLGQRSVEVFDDIHGHVPSDSYLSLIEDIQRKRVAGLIFPAQPPHHYRKSPILDERGIPRVIVQMEEEPSNSLSLVLHYRSFIDKAIGDLVSRGARRLAVVRTAHWPAWLSDHLHATVQRYGIEFRPYWNQQVSVHAPECARELCHLLFHREHQSVRPDGLFITDDNFARHASEGLQAAGVRGTNDVRIVTHCNFPWPTPSALPMRRLGYNTRTVLARAIELIDQCRANPAFQGAAHIEPVFEDEIEAISADEARSGSQSTFAGVLK